MPNSSPMNVLFMAAEADPLIKVGGLGDVAGSLPRAIRALTRSSDDKSLELDIRLVIPFHPAIHSDVFTPHLVCEFPIHSTNGEIVVKAFSLDLDGFPVYLIGGTPIDQETAVYSLDLEADGYKYVFFSLATLELARKLNWKPDILHANDWHTASAVYSIGLHRLSDPFFSHISTLLTVHNLPYLGSMTEPALDAFELPAADHSDLPIWAQHMALPLGLLAADSIVAVSPGYAKEILTEDFGSGLHIFLRAHREKLIGILNGLDTFLWDPGRDIELNTNFSIDNLPARSENKIFLQKELGLEINQRFPLLAMVTRIDPQKGVDLAVAALRLLLSPANTNSNRFQAVFLGSGNPILESIVRKLEADYPDQIRARIMYNDQLSRHIYAGADALLMPSRYEPCGLSQMIAMHYGCVPVARATGGLSDTIVDASSTNQGTGFLFKKIDPTELANAIQRALNIYTHDPQGCQKIQIRAMQQDFSWARSADKYLKHYRKLSGI